MIANELCSAIATISGLTFVVASMLATGLSLTAAQIIQPLKNARLVILALVGNFVLVPQLAYGIILLLPLDQSLQVGLIVTMLIPIILGLLIRAHAADDAQHWALPSETWRLQSW